MTLDRATRTLATVAANPAVLYAVRSRAARGLGTSNSPVAQLGSGELTLLASGKVTPAAARQPFFVEARAAAATASETPELQATLLHEAVAIAPYAEGAQGLRLRAFEADFHAAHYAAAKAVVASLFDQQNDFTLGSPAENQSLAGTGDEENASPVPLPQELAGGSRERRMTFAREIDTVYARTGDTASARNYLLYAEDVAPLPAQAAAVKHEIATLDARQRLAAANAARRPRISKQLDQLRIVRARLTEPPDVLPPDTEVDDE